MLTMFLVMKINVIAKMLFVISLAYFVFRLCQFASTWWNSLASIPAKQIWSDFWRPYKRQYLTVLALLALGWVMPSRTEAIAMYVAHSVSNSSILDRLAHSGGKSLEAELRRIMK